MELSVKTLRGKIIELDDITEDSNLMDIKNQIFDKEGIPIQQQRIIYAGSQLDGNKPLWEYKIQTKSQLHLVVKLKGADNWMNYSIACIVLLLFGWIGLEICALIISSIEYNDDCNNSKLNGYSTEPSTVLIVGPIITIFYMLYKIIIILCIVGLKDNAITQIIDRIFYVFMFSWSIVGFIVYESMNNHCTQQSIGQLLIVWSILHFIFAICCGTFVFYIEA